MTRLLAGRFHVVTPIHLVYGVQWCRAISARDGGGPERNHAAGQPVCAEVRSESRPMPMACKFFRELNINGLWRCPPVEQAAPAGLVSMWESDQRNS